MSLGTFLVRSIKVLCRTPGATLRPWALKYENHYRRLSGEIAIRSLQAEKGIQLDN